MSGGSENRVSSSSSRSSVSIETMITKLLISTKHLLQVLTQWSKGAATGKKVSDAYVQLGNDFKLVSKFFVHAKIDVSDLGDVPMELRKVLEVTLRETPCEETLNRHLPSIRVIIVNLLDKLKVKQAYLKALKQEQHGVRSSSKSELISRVADSPASLPQITIQRSGNDEEIRRTSKAGSVLELSDHKASGASSEEEQSSQSTSLHREQSPIFDFHGRPATAPSSIEGGETGDTSDRPRSVNQEALLQLQKGTDLQRRASKRYSAYHMAKLANQFASENGSSVGFNPPSTPRIEPQAQGNPTQGTHEEPERMGTTVPSADNAKQASSEGRTIFLKLSNKTKKCVLPTTINMNALRLLFVERFSYSPGGDPFPDIYILDPTYNVFYELDEQSISQIEDGAVLELRVESKPPLSRDDMAQFMAEIKNEVGKLRGELLESIKEYQVTMEATPAAVAVPNEPSQTPASPEGADTVRGIKHELTVLRQIHNNNKHEFQGVISFIKEKLEQSKISLVSSATSLTKEYVERSQLELGDLSDNLLSRVDDLQDLIEIMRKDVASRGARPDKKKLETVAEELKVAEQDLTKMEGFIKTEKPQWKKIWEAKLEKVCEEQQFLSLQEDLMSDLREDLKRATDTFNLIDLCCREQEKHAIKPRINPIIPIMKPGTLNMVRNQVLQDVEAINPNHEDRVDAIERAEKLWKMEKSIKYRDDFEEELETFVGNSGLKKSGGVAEIERVRRMKDEENLRANFGGANLL